MYEKRDLRNAKNIIGNFISQPDVSFEGIPMREYTSQLSAWKAAKRASADASQVGDDDDGDITDQPGDANHAGDGNMADQTEAGDRTGDTDSSEHDLQTGPAD